MWVGAPAVVGGEIFDEIYSLDLDHRRLEGP